MSEAKLILVKIDFEIMRIMNGYFTFHLMNLLHHAVGFLEYPDYLLLQSN